MNGGFHLGPNSTSGEETIPGARQRELVYLERRIFRCLEGGLTFIRA